MGIKGWYTVFGDSVLIQKEKDFNNKCIGVDISYDIYRASLGMKNIKSLTDKNGIPTVLLNTLLCNVVRYKKLGIKGLIYVFDNPVSNPHKVNEAEKRRAVRKKAETKIEELEVNNADVNCEEKQKLEKQTFTITRNMVDDVKKLLTLLGVAWIVAPEGYEAEHLGAELTFDGIIDTFITSDSDTLLFGGKSITRRVKNKNTKKYIYEEYMLDNILVNYKLTREQLVHIGVVLGSDFADKTAGIGVGTVLKKGLDIILTDEQTKAKEYFMGKCPYDKNQINKVPIDKDNLIKWLVDDKNFNEQRIEKLLSVF
jgi:flap endonuclease-1